MNKKSFTLIEIIMVIVIIGILAAIAIPRFISRRREAQNASAYGNLAAIRSAILMYYGRTALDEEAWLCTTANPYRSTNTTNPCYPASTFEIENSLLQSPPVWYHIGGCNYDPANGTYICTNP
ncbi:MAG: prepilin-type N-terminal cleavage/methylation domain-containing protein [Candidatus Omnitrophota bacterium]